MAYGYNIIRMNYTKLNMFLVINLSSMDKKIIIIIIIIQKGYSRSTETAGVGSDCGLANRRDEGENFCYGTSGHVTSPEVQGRSRIGT